MITTALWIGALAGLLSSGVFLALALVAAVRFRRKHATTAVGPADLPPVSLLKPVYGMEPHLHENLESFFQQDYPRFEIVFCARSAADPAMAVVRELQQKYPDVPAKTVCSGDPVYPNAKIHAVEKGVAAAEHSFLVLSDSDVAVSSSYIRDVVQPLCDPRVGLVTCLYRGVPTGGLWTRLEALGMSVEMTSGVLVADMLEGMKFALGPTMAFRKDSLQQAGGMAALSDYCADDYVLGNRVAASGFHVVLSHHVIDHVVLHKSFRESLLHQVRWMKSTRFSRPKGHVGTGMTFAMPFGLLGLLVGLITGHWALGLTALAVAILNRVMQSVAVGWGIVRDPWSLSCCWLYPVRDLIGFFLWCASFTSSEIVWRGERYRLQAEGKMVRVKTPLGVGSTPVAVDRLA